MPAAKKQKLVVIGNGIVRLFSGIAHGIAGRDGPMPG